MASSQQHDIQIQPSGSSSSSKRRTSLYEPKKGTSALTGGEKVKNVSRDRIGAERELLVSERQGELARVLDRHDDLVRVVFFVGMEWFLMMPGEQVREVFHLEKFVTMVSFDPKVRALILLSLALKPRLLLRWQKKTTRLYSNKCVPFIIPFHV
jgi:hypothetical protein